MLRCPPAADSTGRSPKRIAAADAWVSPLLATYLGTVTFRPNHWRRLETAPSRRTVPLWSQLSEILQPYADARVVERGHAAIPRADGGLVGDWRKVSDRVLMRAGDKAGEIRPRMFRHPYCTGRLPTLDGAAPVSPYTARREIGHGSQAMVGKV